MKLHNFGIAEALREGRYADAAACLAGSCGLVLPPGTDIRVTHGTWETSMHVHAGQIEAVWFPGRDIQMFHKTSSKHCIYIFIGPA